MQSKIIIIIIQIIKESKAWMNPKQMNNNNKKLMTMAINNLLFFPFSFFTLQTSPETCLYLTTYISFTTSLLWNTAQLHWILIHLTQPDLQKPSSDLCPLRAPSFNIRWRAQTVITNRWLQQRDGRSNQGEISHYHAFTLYSINRKAQAMQIFMLYH